VDLVDETVERPHPVALGEQLVGKMRTDEAGSTRDQNTLGHVDLPPVGASTGRRSLAASFFIYPCTRSPTVREMTSPRLRNLGFLWGAATSAHQVEGGDEASDWAAWERLPQTTCAEPAGAACDHLNRYPDDIRLLADLGLNSYRFSVEWSRIEPEPGRFDDRWLAHYRQMCATCREHGLLPIVTLHHFTNPAWVAEQGGWEAEATAQHFGRFAGCVLGVLGDLIGVLVTINEPNIVALLGYEEALFPPGKRDRAARLRATETFIAAHRLAVAAAREQRPRLPVGLALAMADWQALPGGEAERDEWRRLREDVFLDATGDDDFVGVNTYTRHRIGPGGWIGTEEGVELTVMGYEFWPEAVGATLRRAWDYTGGKTLIVTESGIGTDDDARRIAYIDRAVASMRAAIEDGLDVRGFLYWSALDNFEWHIGYSARFGLIEVDRATQERRLKPSAARLGAIARTAAPPVRP
jgi:beta-glucosidase